MVIVGSLLMLMGVALGMQCKNSKAIAVLPVDCLLGDQCNATQETVYLLEQK